MPPLGYMGKILEVDLSSGQIGARELNQELADRWIGGTALGAHLLAEDPRDAKSDPPPPANAPVSGERAQTPKRFESGTAVPVNGPVPKMSVFSGESGSALAVPASSASKCAPSPVPPIQRSASSWVSSRVPICPEERSTSRILPM